MQSINQAQRAALYLFFFSINFEIWDPLHTGGLFSVAKLTGLIYFATIAPQLQQFIRTDKLTSVLIPIGLFFGLLTMVSLFNVNYLSASFFNFSIFLNIMIFWLLVNHVRYDYLVLERGLLFFTLGSFVLALLYTFNIGIAYAAGRVTLFGENQNAIGTKMSISIVILLLSVIQNRLNLPWYRYLLLIPLPFILKLMADTGSRVAFVQLAMSLIIGTALFKTKNIRGKFYVLVIGVILVVIMGTIVMQSDILMKRLSETAEDTGLDGRTKIWHGIIPLIIRNPIIGVGETGYNYFSMITFSRIPSPHNVILEVMCYSGIIGLTIYLVYLYQICIRGYESYKRKGLLLPILLMIYIFGMLFSGQVLYDKIGWIIFAYNVGSTSIPFNLSLPSQQLKQI